MLKRHSKEKLWQIYKQLPEELKETAASAEVADDIFEIAKDNGIDVENDENLKLISQLVAHVLMGLLLPSDFENELKSELNLNSEAAKKITQRINRLVFYPVKSALEQLNKIEVASQKKTPASAEATAGKEEYQTISRKDDGYREPIE